MQTSAWSASAMALTGLSGGSLYVLMSRLFGSLFRIYNISYTRELLNFRKVGHFNCNTKRMVTRNPYTVFGLLKHSKKIYVLAVSVRT